MIYDITPLFNARLAVWPGDTPLSREVLLEYGQPSPGGTGNASNITLSTLHTTVHAGAHADAPSHYGPGPAIHERPLDLYLGPAQVMHVAVPRSTRVTQALLPDRVRAPRLLLATSTFPNPESWNTDFAALSVDLIDRLHAEGVRLVGIDTPSVDLFDSKDLEAHQAFFRHDMAILEGLVLAHVPAGTYELIALPLRLEGFDASPVRAVLRTTS